MTIVDQLNRAPYLCPFAIQEIRLRLKTKDPEIEILALQLTETIIKNCPSSHAAVAQEDFMRYLVKVAKDQREGGTFTQIGAKFKRKKTTINSKHVRSQCIEKALLILKMLALAYSDSHLYPVFVATYKQLQNQKVRFPETNKDESLSVFSPIHSDANNDPNNKQPTALGSVQNVHLPMIRPVKLLEDVIQPELVSAQEQSELLFTMINAPQLSYDLIPEITQMLRNSQQQIVVIISDGAAAETVMIQALQINDIVNQVLEDAEHIMNGTKRRYQAEVNVKHLMRQRSESNVEEAAADKADDAKDPNEDEVELERSISLEDGDTFAIRPSSKDAVHKRRKSKKDNKQSADLLGLGGGDDLMSAITGDQLPKSKPQESEEDILNFLGVNQPAEPVKPQPQVLDPMDPNFGAVTNTAPQRAPNAFTAGYGNMQQSNNGNVFRDNAVNPMMSNGNMMNPMMSNGNAMPMTSGYNPNANISSNAMHNASAPSMGSIQRGNQSVLNVLTGEPSPPNSYPNSSEVTPQKTAQSPKQATPGKAVSPKAALPQQQTKGADPFGGMDDPFAGMDAPNFDTPSQGIKSAPPQPIQHKAPPATLQKVNSDNIIIDMFASGGPPDPNEKKPAAASPPKATGSDNPFDASNPFGSSADMASPDKADDNPFADMADNPFGDSADVVSDDNPFAMFNPVGSNQQSAKKQDDFNMGDRDPFADM